MSELVPFFIVLLASLTFAGIFNLFHLPWVVTLIFGGAIIGPYGLNVLEIDSTLDFFAEIGLIFLMFMAGLETSLSGIRTLRSKVFIILFVTSIIPFLSGLIIGLYFGYELISSIVLGILFFYSSVVLVMPSLRSAGLLQSGLGKIVISVTVLGDIFSLILISIIFQLVDPISAIPLIPFYALLGVVLTILRFLLPKISQLFVKKSWGEKDLLGREIRFIIMIVIGTVIFFEFLGLHSIIAGFFSGMVLADSIKSEQLREKLKTISYGIFIPIFFVVVGTNLNFGIFLEARSILILTASMILVHQSSKLISGWMGGKIVRLSGKQSLFVGVSTIPQLSTTIAVAYSGFSLGLLDQDLVTALVATSIFSTFVGPVLMNIVSNRMSKEDKEVLSQEGRMESVDGEVSELIN